MFSVHFNVVLLYPSLKIGSFYNNGPNLNRCMLISLLWRKTMFQRLCSALLITFKAEKDVLTHNFIGDWARLTKLSLWALNYYFGAEPSRLWRPETHLSLCSSEIGCVWSLESGLRQLKMRDSQRVDDTCKPFSRAGERGRSGWKQTFAGWGLCFLSHDKRPSRAGSLGELDFKKRLLNPNLIFPNQILWKWNPRIWTF